MMVSNFSVGSEWTDIATYLDSLSQVTKEEVVACANKFFKDNYVVVNKRHGAANRHKVEKPKISTKQHTERFSLGPEAFL